MGLYQTRSQWCSIEVMAIALLIHTPIGKSTQQEPFTAMAAARYIMRLRAAQHVFSEWMPIQYHKVQRWLKEHETNLRKNGRVCDKFIIAIPREFNPKEAEAVLRRFGRRIGAGVAPFLVGLHLNAKNPHAHMMFIDRNPETGKRVFGTSELGSSEKLKLIWAEEVNHRFQEMGVDIRIEFGVTYDLEAYEASLDEEVGQPLQPEVEEQVSDDLPPDAPPPVEAELPAIEIEPELTTAQRAQFAHLQVQELNRVHALQYEREQVKHAYHEAAQAYEASIHRAENARREALLADAARAVAKNTLVQEHTTLFGRKKGFGFSIGGFSYSSPARKAADAAEAAYHDAIAAQNSSNQLHALETERLTAVKAEYQASLERFEAIIGDDAELDEAAALLENAVNEYAGDLSADAILEMMADGSLDKVQARELLDALGYVNEAKQLEADRDI